MANLGASARCTQTRSPRLHTIRVTPVEKSSVWIVPRSASLAEGCYWSITT